MANALLYYLIIINVMNFLIAAYGLYCGTCKKFLGHPELRALYMGALLAGSVLGLKKFSATVTSQELIVITVGLVDTQDGENIRYIRNNIKSQIPAHLYNEDKIFHLRGAIDYSTMGMKHKLMMKFMHSKLSRMPEEELNAESRIILEIYGKKVDYVDFNTLQPIVSIR